MRYTMSLLQDRLRRAGYHVSPIHGVDGSFKRPQFAPCPAVPEPGTLYLTNSEDGGTLVQCTGSEFTVNSGTYPDVCSTIIDICQYFDQWEKDLHEMVWDRVGYQQMIDRTDAVFGNPIFICNWQGSVLGYSTAYREAPIRDFWHAITHENHVPISSLAALMDSAYRDYLSQENQVHFLDFPELNYRSLFGLVHVHNEIMLQFQVIEYDHSLTEADLQLAGIFLDALRHSFRENQLTSHQGALDVFKQLTGGESVPYESLRWALDYLGWSQEQEYHVIAISDRKGQFCNPVLFPQMERHVPGCRLIDFSGNMIMLIPAGVLSACSREISYALETFHLYAAVSMPFTDWTTLSTCYKQASGILRCCTPEQPLCYCAGHVWDLLLESVLKESGALHLIHPALPVLIEYDSENGTDFAHTLFRYLASERSNIDTSAALHIHRNTLKYRLDKIEQLINADLDDLDTRLHLLISCKILGIR